MSTSSAAGKRNLSGKIYDPLFLCMVIAMMLAVGSSVALRAVMAKAGPAGVARGEEEQDDSSPTPARVVKPVEKDAGK